jgi:hypothetical protein
LTMLSSDKDFNYIAGQSALKVWRKLPSAAIRSD